jgi:hypothetical protein
VEVHSPEILQPRALVLMELEITLLEMAADFLPDFNVRAGAYPETLPARLENLILQVRAASQHLFFVAVGMVAQGRSRCQNNEVSRFDELILLPANFLVLSSPVWRIPKYFPVLVTALGQWRCDFTESRAVPDLKRLGFFCAAQRHRICKAVVEHRFLPFSVRDTTEFRPVLKGQATRKLQFGNEMRFRRKARNQPVIGWPPFHVVWQSLAYEDDQVDHFRLLFDSCRQLARQLARPEGQGDKLSLPRFTAGCFLSREPFTPNYFRRT